MLAESLFGVIGLWQRPPSQGGKIYPALVGLAPHCRHLQFIQTKEADAKKRQQRNDILKQSATGRKVDFTVGNDRHQGPAGMAMFMPLLLPVFALPHLPGAVVLYYAVSSIVWSCNSVLFFGRDEAELLETANEPDQNFVAAKVTTERVCKAKKS